MFARWLDIDFAIWCDEQIDEIIRGKDNWRTLRHATASTNKVVNAILQHTRADDGKKTEDYHYANEARLVNWALFGEFKKLERDSLSAQELDPMRGKPCRSGQGQERGRQSRPGGLDWF